MSGRVAGPGLVPARRAYAALPVLLAWLLAGCAAEPPPWDVRPSQRAHFEETRRICHTLTDGDAGAVRPERFEGCMERRGFHREAWWRFWN